VLTTWRNDYGRPSTITAEKVAAIIQGVRAGMSYTGAAKRVGVYQQLASWWKTMGTKLDLRDDLDYSKLSEAEQLYIVLARGVTLAEGTYEWEQLCKLHREAEGDWRARAWLLERRFPEEWSRKLQLRVDLFPSLPQQPAEPPPVGPPTAERLQALRALAAEHGISSTATEPQPTAAGDGRCAEGVHRMGAGMRCIHCGASVDGGRPALPAPPQQQAAPRYKVLDDDGRVIREG
jgi:transposase